ncbi:hypothetical protein LA345_40500 (plasmid) [Burkholderia vietnamiensis]|uniref:Uncharacterized protein n=1 Tax=Burkholderia vietnamiensis (strain G4 / LMG 22486) TaxID=269482 RepID=A4JU14_BURVG|nr:hypothetical protein Bcep1808_6880 [Burkholderia vietnamiensis G4]MCB4350076.1 hypothetical protein [Burkholderia vietnamiensis]
MKIKTGADGNVALSAPQQRWITGRGGNPGALQTAVFAGHVVMAITDDHGGYDLHYLGFETGGFATIDAAKRAAPEFVRGVLAHMSKLIVD